MKASKEKGPQRAKGKTFIGGYIDQDLADQVEGAVEEDRSSVSQFIRTSILQSLNRRKTATP